MESVRSISTPTSSKKRNVRKSEAVTRSLGPDDAFALQEQLLEAMLAATEAGVLRWGVEDAYFNNYSCLMPGTREAFTLRLLWPAFNEESSDRAAARITAPRFGPITVFGGTRGYELVWGIVTAAFPETWPDDYFSLHYGKVPGIVRALKEFTRAARQPKKPRAKRRAK